MDDLTTWLLEQVARDEQTALAMDHAIGGIQSRWSPARLLAECEAKRKLIKWVLDWPMRPSRPSSVDGVLERLALPYADRPGYREEWRP